MFYGIRGRLIRFLVGKNPAFQLLTHGYGLARFMTENRVSKLGYMTVDGSFYNVQRKEAISGNIKLKCGICTYLFDADPDRPTRCPSCGSSDIELAEQAEE